MFKHRDHFTPEDSSARPGFTMHRSLIDMTYSGRYIASAKCSACGQLFTPSAVALVGTQDTEWELVGAFGNHECAPALSRFDHLH